MSKPVIHHLNISRSQRILWLCEELGLDYDIVHHQRDPETQRSPASLCAVHPLGRSPTLVHDGHTIIESDAIIEYVTRRLADGRLSVGPDSPAFGDYLQWLSFAEGSLMGPLVFDLIYAWTGGGNEVMKSFYHAEILKNHQYLDATLATRDTVVATGFTAADVNLGWTLEFSECRGWLRDFPRLTAYLARLRARPAYRRAIARGGPQDLSVFAAGVT